MPFDLGLWAVLWVAVVLFGASYVRGYSGFGFAALIIAGTGLVTDPLYFVPVVTLADLALTGVQLPGIWKQIDRFRVITIFAGAMVALPVGVWLLQAMGEGWARAAISLFILAMCWALWRGWQLTRRPGAAAHVGVGLVSGLSQGAAVGGLPVAAFFAAQPIPAAAFRATIIGYFCLLDLGTLPVLWLGGLITWDSLLATALGLPVMFLGLWLGSRRFHLANPASFRRFAILLLAVLAVLGLLRAAF